MAQFLDLNQGVGVLNPKWANSLATVVSRFGSIGEEVVRPGSGFLIGRKANRCYLATAGHMLFNHDRKAFPNKIEVWLGRNGTAFAHNFVFARDVAQRCMVLSKYRNGNDADRDADIGLVRIDEALEGFGWFPSSSVMPLTGKAKLIGYPQDSNGNQSNRPLHKIVEVLVNGPDNFDYAQHFNYPGLSGGPLVGQTTTNDEPRVFGVHTRGSPETARAVRLSENVRSQLRDWINQQ